MTYSTASQVTFMAQIESDDFDVLYTDFDTSITQAITLADDIIEEYCRVPSGFFDAAGVTVTDEYHDGVEVGKTNTYVRFFGVRKTPFLRLKYSPVISVTTLQEETSPGSWTTRTEGRGNDYVVTEEGVRFIRNIPSYDYQNIKVTYVAGYSATPSAINVVSTRLAASLLHQIVDSEDRTQSAGLGPLSIGVGADTVMGIGRNLLSNEMKTTLRPYKRATPVKIV